MGRLNEVVLTGIVDEENRKLVRVSANGMDAKIPTVETNLLTGGTALLAGGGKSGISSFIEIQADGVADDAAAFQAAINTASETGRKDFKLPQGCTVKLNSGITFRAGAVSLDLNGSILDFSGMTSGVAITINPPLDPYGEYANIRDVLCNGYIKGPTNDATTVDGIKIDRVTAGTGVLTGMSFRNILTKGFRDGIFYDRGAYINHLYNVSIVGAKRYGLNYPGSQYAGENLSMFGGRISDCANTGLTGTGIFMGAGGANQLHLFGTSLDYNDINAVMQSGRLKIFGGNLENNKTSPMFQLDGTGAGDWVELHIAGDISNTEVAPGRPTLISVTGDRCFVDVSSAHWYAYQMTTEMITVVSGLPKITYVGATVLATGGSAQQPKISSYANLIYQGQDAGTPVATPWTPVSGNVAVSVGVGQGIAGGNSIRGIWTGAASSDFYYELPILPSQILMAELNLKVTALASGGVFVRIRFLDVGGNLIQNFDAVSYNAVGGYNKSSSWYRAPRGSAKVRIDIWSGANTATVDVDDVMAWVL